jgi:hypothetical protein
MRTRLFVFASLVLAMAAITFAADDPFTGTWRETEQFTISPNGNGLSIQEDGMPTVNLTYGKDYLEYGAKANTVRVDDHTFKTTYSKDAKVTSNRTETVSPDGKHYTLIQESVISPELIQRGISGRSTFEFDRVGSVPSGDAFLGTWRLIFPLKLYTIKADAGTASVTDSGRLWFAEKLDGKESERQYVTNQAKRIDAQTIELVQKLSAKSSQPSGFVTTVLFQVKGDTLIETRTVTRPNEEPSKNVTHFERIK